MLINDDLYQAHLRSNLERLRMEGNVLKKILEGGGPGAKFIDNLLSNCEFTLQSVVDQDREMIIESKRRFHEMFKDAQNLRALPVEHQQHFAIFARKVDEFVRSLLLYQSGLNLT